MEGRRGRGAPGVAPAPAQARVTSRRAGAGSAPEHASIAICPSRRRRDGGCRGAAHPPGRAVLPAARPVHAPLLGRSERGEVQHVRHGAPRPRAAPAASLRPGADHQAAAGAARGLVAGGGGVQGSRETNMNAARRRGAPARGRADVDSSRPAAPGTIGAVAGARGAPVVPWGVRRTRLTRANGPGGPPAGRAAASAPRRSRATGRRPGAPVGAVASGPGAQPRARPWRPYPPNPPRRRPRDGVAARAGRQPRRSFQGGYSRARPCSKRPLPQLAAERPGSDQAHKPRRARVLSACGALPEGACAPPMRQAPRAARGACMHAARSGAA
jgi:hypothetical protein